MFREGTGWGGKSPFSWCELCPHQEGLAALYQCLVPAEFVWWASGFPRSPGPFCLLFKDTLILAKYQAAETSLPTCVWRTMWGHRVGWRLLQLPGSSEKPCCFSHYPHHPAHPVTPSQPEMSRSPCTPHPARYLIRFNPEYKY